jgi:phenylpyruvate tautomerase
MMTFGGSTDPCALMHVGSIGKLGVQENKTISSVLFKFIKEKLNIEGTR